MAKSFTSIGFTVLLLVVLFISAEIPKSEANCDKFLGEAVVSHYPCSEHACEAQCAEHYHESCKGECEEHDDHHYHLANHDDHEHCHCYGYDH
ncbi:hypothetical protein AALP_AA3G054900 [Arabis alpina]|uniref:Uncharacterized protein n=1 Tax=Arabis alpina TaxID=50452 RepID=A0A087H780_ARAAL|nr:hypothetical protein AALP_AA3G054900 [Arabis alpina]